MKLISIDVGMKNLAYILMEYTEANPTDYTILQWDVVNLTDSDKFICKCLKKNNNICGKKAKYFKNTTYYCKTHAKQGNLKIPSAELNIKKLDRYLVSELKSLVKKYNIEVDPTIKKVTKSVLLDSIKKELINNFLMPIVIKKSTSISLVDYGIALKEKFTDIFNYDDIDKVIIENQIGPLALRMKTLQGMITQHFIENDVKDIEMINSSNKLKKMLGGKKTTYNERKKAGINFTLTDLNEKATISSWMDHFNKHKKKDDLADCYLQGKWFLSTL
tara:strand:+ start:967 stop:1791 length:825 start_codon:yes stop_codon:yes gene_type:complete